MAGYDVIRKQAQEAEAVYAKAMVGVAGGEAFGSLLSRTAENAAAMMGLWAGACDTVLRNFRVAGRQDVARLGGRLAQSDDKLERVLQELYAVQVKLAAAEAREERPARAAAKPRAPRGNGAPRTAKAEEAS